MRNGSAISGYCSWCCEKIKLERSGNFLKRSIDRCPDCRHAVRKCWAWACGNFARWGNREAEKKNHKNKKMTQRYFFCSEHRGDIANVDTVNSKLKEPSEYFKIYQARHPNISKIYKIAILTVGGAIVAVPLSIYTAPVIGGALGRLLGYSGAVAARVGLSAFGFGSLAEGGFGIAGGLRLLTCLGLALGGVEGASIGYVYFRSVKGFSIKKIKGGRGPALLTINGFLTEGQDHKKEWNRIIRKRFPKNPWYHVTWESKRLGDLGSSLTSSGIKGLGRFSITKLAGSAVRQSAKNAAPVLALQQLFDMLIKNPWFIAKTKAEQTGFLVADILRRCRGKKFILLGHSLGCQVISSCLGTLSTIQSKRIASVHLLGGATDGDSQYWRQASKAVSGNIYNYYSQNDPVLKKCYRIGAFFGKQAIGCRRIKRVKKVRNTDTKEIVKSHGEFISRGAEFLAVT